MLRKLSFTASPGATALVGATGAGSSTLLRAMAGTLPLGSAVSGTLRVGPVDAGRATRHELAGHVLHVSPSALPSGTVGELLDRLGCDGAAEGLVAWTAHPLALLPADLRAAAALAVLRHWPRRHVVLMDQVLAAAAPETVAGFRREVRGIVDGGGTVLWAEHRLAEALPAVDRVLEFHRGRLASSGPTESWRPATIPVPGQEPTAAVAHAGIVLDPLSVRLVELSLQGEGDLLLDRSECLGVVSLDGRPEDLARRLTRALRGQHLTTALPANVPVQRLVRGALLQRAQALGLRPGATLAEHGTGEVASLRAAMLEAAPGPVWAPNPEAGLDARTRIRLAGTLRGGQPAPRMITTRNLDFLLSACHRVLVHRGDELVALGAPAVVRRHLGVGT